jgi:hypothetical protein
MFQYRLIGDVAGHDPDIVYNPGKDQMLHIALSHGIAAACALRHFSKAGDG